MNEHLTPKYLYKFKARDLIFLNCEHCKKSFKRRKNNIKSKYQYCSRECLAKSQSHSKMVNCSNCSKSILKSMSSIRKSKSNRSFCSKSCAAIYNNKLQPKRKLSNKCKMCDTLIKSNRLYCSTKCKIEGRKPQMPTEERKDNNKKAVNSYRQKMKKRAVDYKGGKCEICGYNKCIRSLHFHHTDPNKKDFSIAQITRKWEKIKSEIDKCILVCSNCHGEIHSI